MNNMQGVERMRAFVDEMWQSGKCRTITVRYSAQSMLVFVEYATDDRIGVDRYEFAWEDA